MTSLAELSYFAYVRSYGILLGCQYFVYPSVEQMS